MIKGYFTVGDWKLQDDSIEMGQEDPKSTLKSSLELKNTLGFTSTET